MAYSLFLIFGETVIPIGGIDFPIGEIDLPMSNLSVVSHFTRDSGPITWREVAGQRVVELK